jgi:hypothetical protein
VQGYGRTARSCTATSRALFSVVEGYSPQRVGLAWTPEVQGSGSRDQGQECRVFHVEPVVAKARRLPCFGLRGLALF